MRRLFALSALGLLGAVLGCHTAGICDCEGIPDPCGGPPLPFHPVGHHGHFAGPAHGPVGIAGGYVATENGTEIVQETVAPNATVIQPSPVITNAPLAPVKQ